MADDVKNPEVELKAALASVKTVTDEVKSFAETVQTELKNLGKVNDETKANADKALTAMNEANARLTDLEQKMARRPNAQPVEMKSLGQSVVDSAEVKAVLANGGGKAKVTIDTKTILSATGTWGSVTSPSNSLVVADRQPIVPLPMRPMTIRNLLAPGQTTSNAIEFPKQTGFTNNAAVLAENTVKPLSDLTFELATAPVRTIAHRMVASRQILDDAPQLQSFIDSQMRYGLEYAEEAELLNGDGTGQHLLGLIPQAAAYSPAFTVPDSHSVDVLRLAMLQGVLVPYPMSGFVLNPADWAKIEVLKDGMGRYLIGDPQGRIQPMLWGLPVVPSLAMAAGTFLTGAFKYGAQIFDRMAVEVLISTEDSDNFSRNMVTIRCEERLALAVYRPLAFITGAVP